MIDPTSLVVGLSLGFLVAMTICALLVHHLKQKHQAILAAHGIPHGKRASQTMPPVRR
jgi:hypothetical protein